MKGCSGHSTGSMIGVPTLGSVINEFYSSILKPSLSKRTGEFSIVIEERLLKLEREIDGFRVQNYLQNRFSLVSLCKHIK
jgi:hypothetical protein